MSTRYVCKECGRPEGHASHCSVPGIIERAKAEGATEALKKAAEAYQKKVATSDDPIVAFFYLLLRDHMTFGKVIDLVREVERAYELREREGQPAMPVFSNSGLAKIAAEMVDALRYASPEVEAMVESPADLDWDPPMPLGGG